MSLNIRGSFSKRGPKILIFSASSDTFFFNSIGPPVNITLRLNPRDSIFANRPKLYVQVLKWQVVLDTEENKP